MPDESISLEETNKIRISLGLKPLGGDKTSKTETKEQEAENNYAKKREQESKDRELKCVRSVVHWVLWLTTPFYLFDRRIQEGIAK